MQAKLYMLMRNGEKLNRYEHMLCVATDDYPIRHQCMLVLLSMHNEYVRILNDMQACSIKIEQAYAGARYSADNTTPLGYMPMWPFVSNINENCDPDHLYAIRDSLREIY